MNNASVAERLKSFIESKGLTYSQFADACGIPRPSLSQLLTGRNKKINDIMVGQIHNMFPELSIVWLLFGEGAMEISSENEYMRNDQFSHISGMMSADNDISTSNKIIFSPHNGAKSEFSKETGLKDGSESSQIADLKIEKLQKRIKELESKIEEFKKNPRKAVQITVYYDDSTFETFFPR